MGRGRVKVYQSAKDQSFDESGLPDEMKDDYDNAIKYYNKILQLNSPRLSVSKN